MSLSRRFVLGGLIAAPAILRAARAAPLPPLPAIAESDAIFALPGSKPYEDALLSYNKRITLRPALRIFPKTARGMAQSIDWLRGNAIPFALRSGGHSYEGFSQSTGAVLDTRLMKDIALDGRTLSVGAGATLGDIYQYLAPRGLAFPGGSCPTVGIGGHLLGGGFGLLARERGLACDTLNGIELVDANARTIRADAHQNADLFWACRGGGGGTFGAATRFDLAVAPIGPMAVYSATWVLTRNEAGRLFAAWHDWAGDAPDAMTGIFRVSKAKSGKIVLHAAGQSTASEALVRRELRALTDASDPDIDLSVRTMSWFGAVKHFAGGWGYESAYSKAKSDYITRKLDRAGIDSFIGGIADLPPGEVIAICDAYGGFIDRIAPEATAFAYRDGTEFCIQYYTSWASAAAGERRMADLRRFYAAMRPWSGGAYVNYCDLDLADWQQAYWRQNLTRLQAIKAKADPDNVFRHAQSVRPG
jgi:FAD/FMN-containing dehydrogenase